MSEQRRIVRLGITGRVQGVWYRDWTRRTAEELGLSGWVRNRHDGSVEALVAGPRALVAQMIARCHEGPRLARVDAVTVLEEGGSDVPSGFEVRSTG